jgi:hypothetical protein
MDFDFISTRTEVMPVTFFSKYPTLNPCKIGHFGNIESPSKLFPYTPRATPENVNQIG